MTLHSSSVTRWRTSSVGEAAAELQGLFSAERGAAEVQASWQGRFRTARLLSNVLNPEQVLTQSHLRPWSLSHCRVWSDLLGNWAYRQTWTYRLSETWWSRSSTPLEV